MASLFPLREIMLICQGCGGERIVPAHELERIQSVEDLHVFTSTRMGEYACRCGATHCDLRILPSAEAEAEFRAEQSSSKEREP